MGVKISKGMLKRFLRSMGYSWKRFRKNLKSKQDSEVYEIKQAKLESLIKLYQSNFIDLYFGDESGFNMQGTVPYGWQPKGEYIQITPSKTQTMQVFGLLSLSNHLQAYSCKGSVTSLTIMGFLDDFVTKIKRPTVVVLDNAPVHHSDEFKDKVEEWEEKGLQIFYLPKYSPHLNPIEILWRKMKYEWIQYESIHTQKDLELGIERILRAVGKDFIINFKDNKVSNIFA